MGTSETVQAAKNKALESARVKGALARPSLPIRQRALIKPIIGNLPGNAPKYLKVTLVNYDEELQVRGIQPILGLLNDMAAVTESTVGSPDAIREWLDEGMCTAFERGSGSLIVALREL